MRLNFVISVYVLILVVVNNIPTEAKRITLVPLSSSEVYRLLREAGREDAVPEGRVITQGIAAVTGFAAGLTTGVGGSILFDVVVSLLSSAGQNQTTEAQEICFNSRSLNEINDEDEDTPQGRQITASGTTGSGTADSFTNTNTGDLAYVDGENTGTQTASTTNTGAGGSLNCVVIRKPPTAGVSG